MIGAVLAGGRGRRLGGGKPGVLLAGRPLILYPLEVLADVCERVAVVAKQDTPLPSLPASVERWPEPPEPHHPLTGIVQALECAGEAVLICAADMPFVTPRICRTLIEAAAAGDGGHVIAAASEDRLQPLLAVYRPSALTRLADASASAPLTRIVDALEPVTVSVPSPVVRSVNTVEDLRAAEAELRGRTASSSSAYRRCSGSRS